MYGSIRPPTASFAPLTTSKYSVIGYDYAGIPAMAPYVASNVTSPINNVNFWSQSGMPNKTYTLWSTSRPRRRTCLITWTISRSRSRGRAHLRLRLRPRARRRRVRPVLLPQVCAIYLSCDPRIFIGICNSNHVKYVLVDIYSQRDIWSVHTGAHVAL